MSANTWNFPCYQPHDDHFNRNQNGLVWGIGPSVVGATSQPFGETITCLFSFLIRDGWTYTPGPNGIFSIGYAGAGGVGLQIRQNGTSLFIGAWNAPSGPDRYQFTLGDEDGTSGLSADKWYQVGVSMNASGFNYCVNGSTTPKATVSVNTPGALNLGYNARVWLHQYVANTGLTPTQKQDGWSTLVHGPAMYLDSYMDFTDSTVRGRIWDVDGNWKNPGADGSLWFGDTYGATKPEIYLLDGSGRYDNGAYNASIPQIWVCADGGGSGYNTAPGGLRKQYA